MSENKSNEKSDSLLQTKDKIRILIIIIFISIMPFIFTRKISWINIDFTKVGNIGDVIGGITSPFIGILSAILVYLALKAQILANKKQFDANQQQYSLILEQINQTELNNNAIKCKEYVSALEKRLNEFKYPETELTGVEAFKDLLEDFSSDKSYVKRFPNIMKTVFSLILEFSSVCNSLNDSKLNKNDKDIIQSSLMIIYLFDYMNPLKKFKNELKKREIRTKDESLNFLIIAIENIDKYCA
jgi:hypothetical protein